MMGSSRMLLWIVGTMLLGCSASVHAWFEDYTPEVKVSDPYLDMHTGPGRGYPVFYVAGQGESVTILKRKTDWYKVRSERGKEGWVPLSQMRHTLDLDGDQIDWKQADRSQFVNRRWEFGFAGGDLDGARLLSGYIGYSLTPNIMLQVEANKILGDFSDGELATASIVMTPFPDWWLSPFFTVGTGVIHVKPHSTVVRSEDRTDEIAHAGLGANVYLTDRFVMRVEYRRHTVLTSRNDNEEVDQWKAGFSVFF
jgi:opacity protein-like surface antigen